MSSSENWRFGNPEPPGQDADEPVVQVASPMPQMPQRRPESPVQPPAAQDRQRVIEGSRPEPGPPGTVAGVTGLMQKLATLGRTVLPLLPHLLPMDRRVGAAVTAVSGMVAAPMRPQPSSAPRPPAPGPHPLQESISTLQEAHNELHEQVQTQGASLKQLDKEMQTVLETARRQTAEHEELMANWKAFKKKALWFGIVGSVLLIASIACSVILLLRH